MAKGPVDPDDNPEEGPILAPDELDISDSENVRQLDEGRFVVSPEAQPEQGSGRTGSGSGAGSAPPAPEPEPSEPELSESEPADRSESRDSGPAPEPTEEPAELDSQRVHEWLEESFAGNASRYGFDVTATFDGAISQRRMASNDVVTIFESLVLWYAQQIDSDTPVEDILGILLMESNVPIRYPSESLREVVRSTNLGPDDTIADLIAAVDEEDGVKL